jgi:CheY-like chemotaxis protein
VGLAAVPLFLGEDEPGPAPEPKRRLRPRLSALRGGKRDVPAAEATRVLLVEDDDSMRLLLTFNLEASGFEVETAATGTDGVAQAKAGRYDLLLLDVMLPDLGGFDLAERLRAEEQTRDTPIVFISARTSADDLARGRAAGAIDYVTKPFDPVQLGERLREDLEHLVAGGAERVWALRFGSE